MRQIEFSNQAANFLKKSPSDLAARILIKINQLSSEPVLITPIDNNFDGGQTSSDYSLAMQQSKPYMRDSTHSPNAKYQSKKFLHLKSILNASVDTCSVPSNVSSSLASSNLEQKISSLETSFSEGACQVCGDLMSSKEYSEGILYECPSCNTYSHMPCWDYYKGCPIFGCGKNPE